MTTRPYNILQTQLTVVLLFAAVARSRADEKSEAKNHLQMIVTASKNYRAEYAVWPSVVERATNTSRPAKDITVGDPSLGAAYHNSALFNVLRSIALTSNAENANNPRRIVFFETRDVPDPANPSSGFINTKTPDSDQLGCLIDPWGREYFIRFDYDESGSVEGPGGIIVKAGMAAWSLGPDGKPGTNDDITLW